MPDVLLCVDAAVKDRIDLGTVGGLIPTRSINDLLLDATALRGPVGGCGVTVGA